VPVRCNHSTNTLVLAQLHRFPPGRLAGWRAGGTPELDLMYPPSFRGLGSERGSRRPTSSFLVGGLRVLQNR